MSKSVCRLPEFYDDDGSDKDFEEGRVKCLFYILEKEPPKWRMLEVGRPKLKAIAIVQVRNDKALP